MRRRVTVVLAIGVILLLVPMTIQASGTITQSLKTGPYVDRIVYNIIANQDQRIIALQDGVIEMDQSFFDPVHLPTLEADPDINIFSALRNGYGHITINCRDYPLNISGLRRAFAFAFNKTVVTSEIMDGFSQEHDSLLPYCNDFCIEDELEWHYYDAEPDIGNAILDQLNFTIDTSTGYRLAPDGSPFSIEIEYAACSCEHVGGTAQTGVDALRSLHIDSQTKAAEFNEYISRLDTHGDYDMVFYALNFYGNEVDWLADEYWSENAEVPYKNPTNFKNETFDSWRDQLLYATTYEEVFQAAAEMQKILHYNVPRVVVYQNTYMQGYRTDVFTGHVPDLRKYISGPWTMRNIHKLDGSPGGTVNIALSQEPDSFNIFVASSAYSRCILDLMYSSLYDYGPDGSPVADLAKSLVVQTHEDNAAIPEGHTRFIIDIIRNATWSDGVPLTAEDVAFTFNYLIEVNQTIFLPDSDLYGVWAPTPYQVIFEYSTVSYWHFSEFAFRWIIPKHIFNDETGIGVDGWNTWNPGFDPEEPCVISGPFQLTDFDAGEFYELTSNPEFYYYPGLSDPPPPPPTTTTPTQTSTTVTSTTQPTDTPKPIDPLSIAATSVVGVSMVIIIVMAAEILRHKKVA